ncbi:hypothetical protein D3C83_113510 [compost metagenome]
MEVTSTSTSGTTVVVSSSARSVEPAFSALPVIVAVLCTVPAENRSGASKPTVTVAVSPSGSSLIVHTPFTTLPWLGVP